MKAIWNGEVIAESDKTVTVEGNKYFPHDSLNKDFFKSNDLQTTCHWKGVASYYDIEVNGKANTGAAWFYPEAKETAKHIENYVAFWKGVSIEL